jgi:hypothetical protein
MRAERTQEHAAWHAQTTFLSINVAQPPYALRGIPAEGRSFATSAGDRFCDPFAVEGKIGARNPGATLRSARRFSRGQDREASSPTWSYGTGAARRPHLVRGCPVNDTHCTNDHRATRQAQGPEPRSRGPRPRKVDATPGHCLCAVRSAADPAGVVRRSRRFHGILSAWRANLAPRSAGPPSRRGGGRSGQSRSAHAANARRRCYTVRRLGTRRRRAAPRKPEVPDSCHEVRDDLAGRGGG